MRGRISTDNAALSPKRLKASFTKYMLIAVVILKQNPYFKTNYGK